MLEQIPYTLIRLISENGAKGVDIVIIADDVTRPSYKDFGVQVVKQKLGVGTASFGVPLKFCMGWDWVCGWGPGHQLCMAEGLGGTFPK